VRGSPAANHRVDRRLWHRRSLGVHGRPSLEAQLGRELHVVGLADSESFLLNPDGLTADASRSDRLGEWNGHGELLGSSAEGTRAADADILVQTTKSVAADGEPGLAHMRAALAAGKSVVTSDKWPVALHGVELAAAAQSAGTAFRAESTVMSGTPLLAPLLGIAGGKPIRLRGVLNATVNQILSLMGDGTTYEDALEEAKAAGLAEPDPAEDVDGMDSAAKLMVLSALLFGEQLTIADVDVAGLSGRAAQAAAALGAGRPMRETATLDPAAGIRRIEVAEMPAGDPLASLAGPENGLVATIEPVDRVTIRGPGAGPQLAGQGVFSDLLAAAKQLS
jgi:homoserine dehydrogenase